MTQETTRKMVQIGRRTLAGLTAGLLARPALAAWPDRPVRLIVPIAPGGSNDLVARLVGAELANALGQPVVVENRPGGAGQIGMRAAAQSAPDGHTLILANSGAVAITPAMHPQAGYDAVRDFAPISMIMDVPIMLVVRHDLPARNVGELIALMRRDAHAVTFGSPGAGQTPHLATELFLRAIGVDATIATYRGAAPAANDFAAGVTQALFDTSSTLPLVGNQTARILAVTGRNRSALLPQVPTLRESGIDGMELGSWFVLLAPAGVPPAVLGQLNTLTRAALAKPEIRERLASINAEPRPTAIEDTRNQIAAESAYWQEVIRRTGLTVGN